MPSQCRFSFAAAIDSSSLIDPPRLETGVTLSFHSRFTIHDLRVRLRVRKLESHNRRPDAVSCFFCIMPHMESTFSDLIGRDCLTPQGDRATVELYSSLRELSAASHRY